MPKFLRPIRVLRLVAMLGLVAPAVVPAAPASGADLLRTYCSGCHRETAPASGEFERIASIRKSPEGWVMTLFRMKQVHGLNLPEADRDALVRYLADAQGLAPAESAAGRFALERRPNVQDLVVDADLDRMCGRCHTNARVSLQRRDSAEWLKLAHTHVGQWPSLEYQASARDRQWWTIATTQLPERLGRMYPLHTPEWAAWQARRPTDLSGAWVVVGRIPGRGDYYGTAQIQRTSAGDYTARYALRTLDGTALDGESKAIVYTGYEWRGSAQLGGRETREVFAASEDGTRLQGRWFEAERSEEGGNWLAVRADAPPAVLAVLPRAVKAGSAAGVVVVGTQLDAKAAPAFGADVRATVRERTANVLKADLVVAPAAAAGARAVGVGGAGGGSLAIYRQVDRIEVLPGYGIARLGGGRLAPVTAQYEAWAYATLPDGSALALGVLPASWEAQPFDAEAKRTKDEQFAGRLDERGRFLPAGAGPNPVREFSGNNVGNLAIVARVQDGDRTLEARSRLIVTVQRWNTPPIY